MKIIKKYTKNNKKIISICGIKFSVKNKKTFSEVEKIFHENKDKTRFVETSFKLKNRQFTVPDAPSVAWQIKEIFGDECYKFLSSSKSPVIYDCGANVGLAFFISKRFILMR